MTLDCFQYREVLANMLSQELKVKYKRTFLGYFWSLLNPILQLLVLSAVFSHIMRFTIKDYALFLFSGLVPFTFLQNSLTNSASSLIHNEGFIKKIYLPKMIFPLSKTLLGLIDFFFALIALSLIGKIMQFDLSLTFFLVPTAALLLFMFTFGLGLILATLTVYFRDIQYILTVFLNLLYFLTPILYPMSAIPEQYHIFLKLNPVYWIINLFHALIYQGVVPPPIEWGIATGLAFLSLGFGLRVLSRTEQDLVFRL